MKLVFCLEDLKKEIRKINNIIELASSNNNISSIEKDIILESLRSMYDSLLFAQTTEQALVDNTKKPEVAIKEPAPEIKVEEKSIENSFFNTSKSINRDMINTLYGDAAPKIEQVLEQKMIFNEIMSDNNKTDIASALSSQVVIDIKKSIGINDRFLIIKELFAGEISLYERSIAEINSCTDATDAFIYMQENFSDKVETDAFKLLFNLIERKFS